MKRPLPVPAAMGTGLYEQVESAVRDRHLTVHLVEHPTAETIKNAVALGMGAAILPFSAVREELSAGKLRARRIIGWPDAERIVHALVRSEGRPPSNVQALIDALRRHYAGA